MSRYIICNTIDVYKQAPVSTNLLESYAKQIIEAFENKEGKKFIVLDSRNQSTKTVKEILEHSNPQQITIIEVEPQNHFVYTNPSAIFKLIDKEKPLPNKKKCETKETEMKIYTPEQLLNQSKKEIFISIENNTPKNIKIDYNEQPLKILENYKDKKCKAIYFGYPMNCIITEEDFNKEIEITTDLVQIYTDKNCMLYELNRIIENYIKETCGRCVYGYEGLTQISMILSDIEQKKGKTSDLDQILDLCQLMNSQTLCEIGESIAKIVSETINKFRQEIEEHITKRNCKAEVCSKFVTYHILQDLCTGCDECVCEEDAIIGRKRFIHIIVQDECTQCGKCVETCDENAIVKAGIIKPRCPKKPIPIKRK